MNIARRKLLAGGALAGGVLAMRPAFAATVPVQVVANGVSPAFRAAFDRFVAFAEADIGAWGFPAISLSLRSGAGEVATAAVGLANLDRRAPVTTAHLFQIGSISKSFVAVATRCAKPLLKAEPFVSLPYCSPPRQPFWDLSHWPWVSRLISLASSATWLPM